MGNASYVFNLVKIIIAIFLGNTKYQGSCEDYQVCLLRGRSSEDGGHYSQQTVLER